MRLLAPVVAGIAGIAAIAGMTACRPGAGDVAADAAVPLQAVHARSLRDVTFERTPERIERGRYLATAAIGCVVCHSERDRSQPGEPPLAGREFAGRILSETPDSRTVAPNLTPDVATGAGSWSDDMLARAIREGVGHDGRGLGGPMWWWAFRDLSDEDLASIVVYLRSIPPVRHQLPPRRLSAQQEQARAEAARPLSEPVPEEDLSDPVARGRYLLAIADCMGCHSSWEAPKMAGAFAGGNAVERDGTIAWSANITPDPLALGAWTPEMFRARIRTGRGGTLHPTMPWVAYRNLSDDDLDAIFAALREVEPVTHLVNNVEPPTPCPVCGQTHPAGELNRVPVFERVDLDPATIPALAGTYRNEKYDLTVTIRIVEEKLVASEGGAPIELVPCADGWFRGHGLVGPYRFERDAAGRVTALFSRDLGLTRYEPVAEPPGGGG